MASEYEKIFSNPYPSGWENLPSMKTPIIAQALQQHTNAIINIEAFLEDYPIPTNVSDLYNDGVIPTKVSDLLNDLGFVRDSQVPRKTSQLQNDVGFMVPNQIPKNLSEYINNVGFITDAVNTLLNYYLKTETYSKNEIDQLLSRINNFNIEVVDELPTVNISPTTIYCVPKATDNTDLGSDYILDLESNVSHEDQNNIEVGDPVTTETEVGGLSA